MFFTVRDRAKAEKIFLTESTEFAESIDSIDSFLRGLRVLCEKILLLHNPSQDVEIKN